MMYVLISIICIFFIIFAYNNYEPYQTLNMCGNSGRKCKSCTTFYDQPKIEYSEKIYNTPEKSVDEWKCGKVEYGDKYEYNKQKSDRTHGVQNMCQKIF